MKSKKAMKNEGQFNFVFVYSSYRAKLPGNFFCLLFIRYNSHTLHRIRHTHTHP